jgi:hypothetical protein
MEGVMLATGQPLGSIFQVAYVVPSLEAAITHYASCLGAAPWVVLEHFQPLSQQYRGQPTALDLSIALAFSGSMMIELIQQHDDLPSVYGEVVDSRGYGFHHFAVTTRDFEADSAKYSTLGYETVFEAVLPDRLDRARVAYFDARANLPGMIELVEINEKVDAFFGALRAAATKWDGKDLIHPLPAL